jgi:predicted N-acetyltransferase YhbS
MDQVSSGKMRLLEAVTVRQAGIDDLAAIRRLLIAAFQAFSTAEHSEEEAAAVLASMNAPAFMDGLRQQTLHVAWLDQTPVAVSGWRMTDDSGRAARIGAAAVDPMFGYLGLGRLVAGYSEQSARRAGYRDLVVHASRATEGFFQHLGFETTAYSVRAIDAATSMRVIYMRKSLPVLAQPVAKSAIAPKDRVTVRAGASRAVDSEVRSMDFGVRPMLSKASH